MPFKRGQLRNFVTVADEGQMTRAAHKLHIAQPALSQAIAQLEAELGIQLLERHPRGVALTPAGEAFLPKARAALEADADAAETARALARNARATIQVGFIGSPPIVHVPEIFEAFSERHPEVNVCFRDLPFPRAPLVHWLEDVDAAICHPPGVDPKIGILPLRSEPRVMVAAASHPLAAHEEVAVEDVLGATFLAFHPGVDPVWAGFWRLDDHRGRPAENISADTVQTVPEMLAVVAAGQAVTTLPSCHVETILKVLPGTVAVRLADVRPAVLSMLWPRQVRNPLVADLLAIANET